MSQSGQESISAGSFNMNSQSIKRHFSSPRISNSLSPVNEHPRRSSIQENFAQFTRTLSTLRLTPSKSSGEGWNLFGVVIDKDMLENVLVNHYEDLSIKVFFYKGCYAVIIIFLGYKAIHA